MKIFVVVKIISTVGNEAELFSRLVEVATLSRLEEGCLTYDLFKEPTQVGVFYFLVSWQGEEFLAAHDETAHVLAFRADRARLTQSMEITRLIELTV